MKSVVTLAKGNDVFKTFVLNEDGSAKENGKKISDFADLFLFMVDNGYRKISEANIAVPERETIPASIVSKRETFRTQWNEYLSEYSDNLEIEYA